MPMAEMTATSSHVIMAGRESSKPPFCSTYSDVTRIKAAQPFMLIVVHIDNTKRDTSGLTLIFSSAERMVTGSVAAEDLVKRAISTAGDIFLSTSKGLSLRDRRKSGSTMKNCTQFDLNSVDELLNISHRFPAARWILFSNELSEGFIRRLSFEQNMSMILKDANTQELTLTLRYNMKGERYLSPNIMSFLITESSHKNEVREKLTASEIEILKLVAQGKSVKEIADERSSSTHTITTHKKNIFRKLNVNTVYEATKYALSSGLVDMAEYYI